MASEKVCLDVVAGCYERTVLGYEVVYKEEEESYSIRAKFTDNSHIGYIKSIAASRTFLASGSTDETIHLYNLRTNRELGTLLQHDGSITCLCFHGDSHMVSSSEDGSLCVWNTDTWDCMKVLKGHKSGINSVAVHPSGKLALSVGVDKTLRTWNLLRGRAAYTTNIKQVADHVLWSPDGELYIVVVGNVVNVYDITTASVSCSIDYGKRINASVFLADRVIAVGGEGNEISLYEISKTDAKCCCQFKAHENRIKSLQSVAACSTSSSKTASVHPHHRWLLSASSDGFIKLWSLHTNKLSEEPVLLAELNTTARLTCLTVRPTAPSADQGKPAHKQTATKRNKATEETGEKPKKKKVKP